ncbi:hypothetical protein AAMO2058_000073700 [Amorphochlora amoebiformis]
MLNVFKFRKWLNGQGKPYKKAAGGMSDDGLYTVSPKLRELMPRGLHEVKFIGKDSCTTVLFRGIPKFSGLVASDEDEESNASASIFFYDGQSLQDAGRFYVTAKSNGENAKLGCRIIEGTTYLFAGSKNTCMVWPALIPRGEIQPATDHNIPAQFICLLWSHWYLKLSGEQQKAFATQMTEKFGTIMGEINTPWYEHVVPINELFLECYAILDNDGRPVHPKCAFDFFKTHGIHQHYPSIAAATPAEKKTPHRPENLKEVFLKESNIDKIGPDGLKLDAKTNYISHVFFQSNDIKDLDDVVDKIRNASNTEGAVLYLTHKTSEKVIGLVKVKSSQYVVWRRLRETMKSCLFRPLNNGEIEEFPTTTGGKPKGSKKNKPKTRGLRELLQATKKVCLIDSSRYGIVHSRPDRIHRGMRSLSHVPGCKTNWRTWSKEGMGFADWWCKSRLLDGKEPNRVDVQFVYKESKCRYASLVTEYRHARAKQQTGSQTTPPKSGFKAGVEAKAGKKIESEAVDEVWSGGQGGQGGGQGGGGRVERGSGRGGRRGRCGGRWKGGRRIHMGKRNRRGRGRGRDGGQGRRNRGGRRGRGGLGRGGASGRA